MTLREVLDDIQITRTDYAKSIGQTFNAIFIRSKLEINIYDAHAIIGYAYRNFSSDRVSKISRMLLKEVG